MLEAEAAVRPLSVQKDILYQALCLLERGTCWATSVTVTEANTQQVVPFNEQKGVGFYGSTIVKSAEETLVGSKACQYWYHIMTCVAREVPRRPTLTRLIG